MQIIENKILKEKVYIEELETGFTIMCIPKKDTRKKYAVFSVEYGSNDNQFIIDGENERNTIPDGVAHFLEHKLFEQENGTNSLDVLSSLGVDANAYTTNDHTAYLFECTNNFEPALDELLKYVQNPYFTDENVEKEKGIIAQEINMYDDEPEWKAYINCMKGLYHVNPIRIDVAGSVESIQKINKEILYKCYNNFYVQNNMILVVCGNFKPEEIIEKIKKKITLSDKKKAKVIELAEPDEINKKEITEEMEISIPIFTIGYKLKPITEEKTKINLSLEIILEILFGIGSKCYKELYEKGLIYENIFSSYEYARDYAHILIQGKTTDLAKTKKIIKENIEEFKRNGITDREFERAKRKIYGQYVKEYNDVSTISLLAIMNYFRKISPFENIEKYNQVTKEYVETTLNKVFVDEKMVESYIIPKHINE